MSVLEKPIVLKLNANWQPIGVLTPEQAFVRMSRPKRTHYSKEMKRPYSALHIEYPLLPNGNIDFSGQMTLIPVEWKDWIALPVRPQDNFVGTARQKIRVPTVVIANNYNKVPSKSPSFSKNAVWIRDNFTCRVTGKKLSKKTGNIEHLIASSKDGETSFKNCYLIDKEINQLKGDMSPAEFEKKYGYRLPRPDELKVPTIARKIENRFGIKDWEIFLT